MKVIFPLSSVIVAAVTTTAPVDAAVANNETPSTKDGRGLRRRHLSSCANNHNYDDLPLRAYEEIAYDLTTRTNGVESTTHWGYQHSTCNFKLVQSKTEGAHATKMTFYTDTAYDALNGVEVSFSDGSRGFCGYQAWSDRLGVEVVKNLGKMSDSIIVQARNGNRALVDTVYFQSLKRTIGNTSTDVSSNAAHVYDVDGRYITGLVCSDDDNMRNLQFLVSKPVKSSQLVDINYDLGHLQNPSEAKTLDVISLSNDSSEAQSFSVSYSMVEESSVSVSSERTSSFEMGIAIGISTEFGVDAWGVSASASFSQDYSFTSGHSYTSGKVNEKATSKEVVKEVSITVPPSTSVTLTVTQFQETLADIDYTATHVLTFEDNSYIQTSVKGEMEGVAVSNVFMDAVE